MPKFREKQAWFVRPVPADVLAQVRAQAVVRGLTIRGVVLEALAKAGLVEFALTRDMVERREGTRLAGSHPGRPNCPQLGCKLPVAVIAAIRKCATSQGLTVRGVLLKALAKSGISIPADEICSDRRSSRSSDTRRHYASR
jgi:hypothetical protein